MRQRTSDTNSASFGLYPHWHPYVRPLATFLRFVNINLVTSTINEMSEKGGTPQIGRCITHSKFHLTQNK